MNHAWIFLIGGAAGFIAAIIGGAGVLTLPALMLVGLSPQMAIATTKFASVGFWIVTLFKFNNAGRIAWRFVLPICLVGAAGSFIGTKIVLHVPEEIMKLVAVAGILAFLPLLLKKDFSVTPVPPTRLRRAAGYAVYFLIAVYGGFLGAGQGILTSLAFVSFFGLTITESRATDGLPRIMMAVASLAAFTWSGVLDLGYGVALMLGMMTGGWFGAHTAIRKGDAWVQRIFVAATIAMSGYLMWEVLSSLL